MSPRKRPSTSPSPSTSPLSSPSPPSPPPPTRQRITPSFRPLSLPRPTKTKSIAELEAEISEVTAELTATLDKISKLDPGNSSSRSATRADKDDDGTLMPMHMPMPMPPQGQGQAAQPMKRETDVSSTTTTTTTTTTADFENTSPAHALTRANHILDRHIALLREYNDIKDVAMAMLSLIADRQGVTLGEVMAQREPDGLD